jgi:hypothetical protein
VCDDVSNDFYGEAGGWVAEECTLYDDLVCESVSRAPRWRLGAPSSAALPPRP